LTVAPWTFWSALGSASTVTTTVAGLLVTLAVVPLPVAPVALFVAVEYPSEAGPTAHVTESDLPTPPPADPSGAPLTPLIWKGTLNVYSMVDAAAAKLVAVNAASATQIAKGKRFIAGVPSGAAPG
jgi:hypothetical protein